jgi:hypothetical protein
MPDGGPKKGTIPPLWRTSSRSSPSAAISNVTRYSAAATADRGAGQRDRDSARGWLSFAPVSRSPHGGG